MAAPMHKILNKEMGRRMHYKALGYWEGRVHRHFLKMIWFRYQQIALIKNE